MSTAIGRFDVEGNAGQVRLIRRTLERCDPKVGAFLDARVTVEFTQKLPLRGDGGPAWAFAFFRERRIGLNPGLGPGQVKYAFLHEVGHFVDLDHLTPAKRRDLMALMRPRPDTGWAQGPYRPMPAEVFAEWFVAMVSEVRPLNRNFYQRRIGRLDDALAVVERVPPPKTEPEPDEPPPDEETEPLPEPEPDPVEELEAAIADRDEQIQRSVAWYVSAPAPLAPEQEGATP